MNADFTVKPPSPSAGAAFVKTPAEPLRGAVATELPADKSVAQGERTSPPSNNASAGNGAAAQAERQSRQTLYDERLAQVIYRVVDSETKRVVRQVPDQALLRLRAYSRALQSAEEAAQQQKTLHDSAA